MAISGTRRKMFKGVGVALAGLAMSIGAVLAGTSNAAAAENATTSPQPQWVKVDIVSSSPKAVCFWEQLHCTDVNGHYETVGAYFPASTQAGTFMIGPGSEAALGSFSSEAKANAVCSQSKFCAAVGTKAGNPGAWFAVLKNNNK